MNIRLILPIALLLVAILIYQFRPAPDAPPSEAVEYEEKNSGLPAREYDWLRERTGALESAKTETLPDADMDRILRVVFPGGKLNPRFRSGAFVSAAMPFHVVRKVSPPRASSVFDFGCALLQYHEFSTAETHAAQLSGLTMFGVSKRSGIPETCIRPVLQSFANTQTDATDPRRECRTILKRLWHINPGGERDVAPP